MNLLHMLADSDVIDTHLADFPAFVCLLLQLVLQGSDQIVKPALGFLEALCNAAADHPLCCKCRLMPVSPDTRITGLTASDFSQVGPRLMQSCLRLESSMAVELS